MSVSNIFIKYPSISNIDYIQTVGFSSYRDSVVDLLNSYFKDQDIKGESNKLYKLSYINIASLLTMLMYTDINKGFESLGDLVEYYNIDDLRKCFACYDIDIDTFLKGYKLANYNSDGVKRFSIGETFVVKELDQDDILWGKDIYQKESYSCFNILNSNESVEVLTTTNNEYGFLII